MDNVVTSPEEHKCGDCSHFIGMGDWGLCCDLSYSLCYEDTNACGDWNESKEEANE